MATWSGIRKKLENEYLAQSLKGHVQYFVTAYSKCPDHEGRVAVRYDKKEIFRTNNFEGYWNECTIRYKLFGNNENMSWDECCSAAKKQAAGSGKFEKCEFLNAFAEFDNQSIERSLNSDNAIVRMFALLDKRVGKRRLIAMKDKMQNEQGWIKCFYILRMTAENLLSENEKESLMEMS